MGNDRLLRTALWGNATFSGACGALLLVAPGAVGAWLGADGGVLFPFLGAGLLTFAAGLVFLATRPRLPAGCVRAVILADALWVAGTVAFFLTPWSAALSERGARIVMLVATVVCLWGVLQAAGLWVTRSHGPATAS